MAIADLKHLFENPGSEYRDMPFWDWNSDMTDEEIEKVLEEYRTHGFGGAFIHPRPGLTVPYLSDEWFERWEFALKTAEKKDLQLGIYDENSYPSGFGGGHVPAELPDCMAVSVVHTIEEWEQAAEKFGNEKTSWLGSVSCIRVFACEKTDNNSVRLVKDVTDLPPEEWGRYGRLFSCCEIADPRPERWMAGFAYMDLLRPEVTKVFIQKVYEPYYQRFGKYFGNRIPAIFMDEPSLSGSAVYGRTKGCSLPFSRWFAYEFQKRNGYDVADYLPALFLEAEADWFLHDYKKVRFDYCATVQELWTCNFIIPVTEWAKEHGIAMTGHFMEDEWPRTISKVVSPPVMSNYEYMQWPGIDLLMTFRLDGYAYEPAWLLLQEVGSVSRQLGKEKLLCEAFGAGGYDASINDFKRIGDWLLVNGFNKITEHLTYTSYAGARKRDHPQSFDHRQPWWEEYAVLTEYFARMSALLSQGKARERILVLHPSTSGYFTGQDGIKYCLHRCSEKTFISKPDMRDYYEILKILRTDQWDFDLGDEYILQRHGKAESGLLKVAEQEYEAVVITAQAENLLSSTLNLLMAYMEAGGRIYSVGFPGNRVDGKEDPDSYKLLLQHPNFTVLTDGKALSEAIGRKLRRRLTGNRSWPEGLEHLRKEIDEKHTVYFFYYHGIVPCDMEVMFEGASLEEWNPWNGRQETAFYQCKDKRISLPLRLENAQSVAVLVSEDNDLLPPAQPDRIPEGTLCELKLLEAHAADKNVLTLDYCDLLIDGKCYPDIEAFYAGRVIYQKRGFVSNPWDVEVQYKARHRERNQFGERSGFAAVYHFFADKEGSADLELAVEYGSNYEVSVNGTPVIYNKNKKFLDQTVCIYEISDCVRCGLNEIRLECHKFDIKLGLDAVFLRGSIAAIAECGHWKIAGPQPLEYGLWTDMGYGFYGGAVEYTYCLNAEIGKKYYLDPVNAMGTAVSCRINGLLLPLNLDGRRPTQLTRYLNTGRNDITIKVSGSLKNTLGPFHDPSHPRKTAWPNMWRHSPRCGQPRPEEYDLIGYGLCSPPAVRIAEPNDR